MDVYFFSLGMIMSIAMRLDPPRWTKEWELNYANEENQ